MGGPPRGSVGQVRPLTARLVPHGHGRRRTRPPIVAVVGADRVGQDRPAARPRRAARRRGRQHRRDAALPRHGHRYGQAAAGRAARDPAPPARHCSRCASPRRWRSSRAGRGRSIAELRGAGPGAGAGRAARRSTRARSLDRFEFPGTDADVRARLGGRARRASAPPALHARLADVDPEAAARIQPDNGRRIVRALEVVEITGRPFSASLPAAGVRRPAPPSRSGSPSTGPRWTRGSSERVAGMFDDGFVDEVERLLDEGLAEGRTASPGDRLPRGGGPPRRRADPRRGARADGRSPPAGSPGARRRGSARTRGSPGSLRRPGPRRPRLSRPGCARSVGRD